MTPIIILVFSLFASSAIMAQQSTTELAPSTSTTTTESESTSTDRIERLQVTGSYIQRIDIEGPSPIEMINQEDFANTGSITLNDILQLNPSFQAAYEGSGHVRFRGQHAGNVLILLNGMRLPKLNGGYYTSINGIPTSVIERVELLKDGGSAIYGSDAMSGVMNFKTRRDYDGADIQASTTIAESGVGTQTSYTGTFGRAYSRGNIMGVIQVEGAEPYSELDVGSYSNSDRNAQSITSNATIEGVSRAEVGVVCPGGRGRVCETDSIFYTQTRSDKQDITGLLTASYEFAEMDLSLLGMFNRRSSISSGSPLRLNWRDNRKSGGSNNAIALSSMSDSPLRDRIINDGLVDGNGFVNVSGTLVEEFGNVISESQDDNIVVQTDLKGYTNSSWIWNVQAGFATLKSEREVIQGEANQEVLKELFRRGEMDVLAPQGAKSDLSSSFIRPTYRNDGEMITGKAVMSGELFDLGNLYSKGGLVSMAFGYEGQVENFAFNNDAVLLDGLTLANPTRNFSGSRAVHSAFMELSAYPLQNLEVQVAHRFDHYSDVGNTYNPKLALAYTPVKEVLLRSSVGTGFRAPGITDLYSGTTTGTQLFSDLPNCPPTGRCDRRFYEVTTFTDPDLESETSLHYSFGTVIQPNRNVSFTLDQWNYEGKNSLSAVSASRFSEIEKLYGTEAFESTGARAVRDENGKLISMSIPAVMNIGSRELRGLDGGFDIRFDLSDKSQWRMNFSAMHSLIFENNDKRYDFADEVKNESWWKNRIGVGLRNDNHNMNLSALTVASSNVGNGNSREKLSQYTELDFSYGYNTFWGGRFNMAVRNLLNTRPPVALGGDTVTFARLERSVSSFSPLRRRFYIGYSQSF
jgi:iron complex outermembrane recepter protein